MLAFVSWFQVHPDRDMLQPPLEIWQNDFVADSAHSFIQISKISYPVAITREKYLTSFGDETVVVTVPLVHISSI